MAVNYRSIGKKLRLARNKQGITQQSLAEKVNVSAGYICQVERGAAKASLEFLSKLCIALDIDIHWIICQSALPENEPINDAPSSWDCLDSDKQQLLLQLAQLLDG